MHIVSSDLLQHSPQHFLNVSPRDPNNYGFLDTQDQTCLPYLVIKLSRKKCATSTIHTPALSFHREGIVIELSDYWGKMAISKFRSDISGEGSYKGCGRLPGCLPVTSDF